MFGCCQSLPPSVTAAEARSKCAYYERKVRDYKITTFALTIITLVLVAAGCILFGTGTLSPLATRGLGIFHYLGGVFAVTLGIGLLTGTIVTAIIAGVMQHRNEQWRAFKPKRP